jgi:hypothetical protein
MPKFSVTDAPHIESKEIVGGFGFRGHGLGAARATP